ncbi:MAG TPA: ROK family protein [Cytophagales bacterium]|nr:ROK family protein [Cytophagales bacterium]
MTEVVLGIDIGGTNTKFGFVDADGNCYESGSMPTNANEDVSAFLPRLFENVDLAIKKSGDSIKLRGIGIGVPNGNYFKGTVERPPNLKWGTVVNLSALIKKHYNIPVALTNDANAAALGEMKYGAAKGMKDFIVITLGTGLGSGIVVNGNLVYGADGFAGEIGHTLVNVNGRWCGCGRRGCLETYVSATGIKRTVYKLLADYTESSELHNYSFNELTAEMITEAGLRGDKIALEAFEYTARILGMKLADTVAHTSPEAIILFGGLVNANELIFTPTLYHMEKNMLAIYKNKVKLLPSKLMNKNAAVLGASALIWKEIEDKGL